MSTPGPKANMVLVRELETIVRGLAAYPIDDENGKCIMCGEDAEYVEDHSEPCPWREATEWVKAHPADPG